MAFSASQLQAFDTAEKVASVFSVIGAIFIIFTFLLDHRFRKAINRLVFYACWGNLFSNVATLISRAGISLGVNSALCQFQAFLIQWFMPADALWTFAMACNVYLSFFHRYDATRLRTLEWRYLVACYGVPFLPALVFLFIDTPDKGKIYGDAVLWCWVSEDWNALRIATFYGPVWLVILITMFVYIKVGLVVFRWRKKLLSSGNHSSNQVAAGKHETLQREYSMRDMPQQRYGVTIHSQVPHTPDHKRGLSSPRNTYMEDRITSPTSMTSPTHMGFPSGDDNFPERQTRVVVERPNIQVVDANKAALSYCKTAMLFFVALIVVWVPSTINRVYTLVSPNNPQFGLEFASGLVLPLQGCWNTVIYIVTSLPACRALWADLMGGVRSSGVHMHSSSLTLPRSTHQTLPSTDQRADIMVTYEGKNRIVHHSRRASRDHSTSGIIGHAGQMS
ncbi:hypothetical protein PV05_03365 [Exophiala xenobiotica]|uniref:G-protein coupled receptors family 2 profile 2 domain-containing protein n=1 Tax=Exophiala xenobiotica TaxID=348802 RepID=A0A0D2D986_9EURO|nr:uncharacterized protein PV05_03365 [Exophiala xenobiotica]KIW58872.1 hypothetical protein PV05_03365 [Exophiala xenobiotica]